MPIFDGGGSPLALWVVTALFELGRGALKRVCLLLMLWRVRRETGRVDGASPSR